MPARRLAAACALLAFGASGCRRDAADTARERAAQAVLKRRVEDLRELVALAEKGSLLSAEQFAIGVDEALVRDLLAASLPREQTVAGRFRVRVERAEVAFGAHESRVTLRGRVTSLEAAATFVDVVLLGGLAELTIDPSAHRLKVRVSLDHLEVDRAAAEGATGPRVAGLIGELGREPPAAFESLVPAFEIPLALEQGIALKGFSNDGGVRMAPGELPLSFSVTRAIPLSGRLWVLLQVAVGPWRPTVARTAVGPR